MPSVYCIMGPTASGKTAHALALAARLPIEIISVDATLVYRGLDVGSAKPSLAELGQCQHHLIDIRDPIQVYSVAEFIQDAGQCIEAIMARGRIPVLVGGSMLYFRALQQGLSPLPAADLAIRADIEAWATREGWDAVHQALTEVDPVAAARIRPQDTQRLSRAMEVYRLTGQALSLLQGAKQGVTPYHFVNIGLFPRRAWLHERIEARFHQMLRAGFVSEVEGLIKRWPGILEKSALRAVGYRQVVSYLQGALTQDELTAQGIAATRQLAKRQCTWLRSWPSIHMIDSEAEHSIEILLDACGKEKK